MSRKKHREASFALTAVAWMNGCRRVEDLLQKCDTYRAQHGKAHKIPYFVKRGSLYDDDYSDYDDTYVRQGQKHRSGYSPGTSRHYRSSRQDGVREYGGMPDINSQDVPRGRENYAGPGTSGGSSYTGYASSPGQREPTPTKGGRFDGPLQPQNAPKPGGPMSSRPGAPFQGPQLANMGARPGGPYQSAHPGPMPKMATAP